MRERGDLLVGILAVFLVFFPLGYLVHASPRFPGSLAGSLTGVVAAILMFMTVPYIAAKHIPWFAARTSGLASKPTLLAIHVYAGVLAPLVGLVHAAHKFESPLSLVLTGVVLLTVLTGMIGRYFLGQVARALRGRRSELASLKSAYLSSPASPSEPQTPVALVGWRRLFFVSSEAPRPIEQGDGETIAAAMADVEFAIRAEDATARLFGRWRLLHIVAGCFLYLLLALHIGASIYFGLRWL